MFSVVIPTCDRPKYLERSISSVLAQTLKPNEIIVVDNGTQPVDPLGLPKKVRLISAEPRIGVAAARNLGVVSSLSKWIAFLDDDDQWNQSYLAEMARSVALNPSIHFFAGAMSEMSSSVPMATKNDSIPKSAKQLLRRNPGFVGSNLVVSKDAFMSLGGFDPNLRAAEDTDLAIRIMKAGLEISRVSSAISMIDTGQERQRLTDPFTLLAGRRLLLRKHVPSYFRRSQITIEYMFRLAVSKLLRRSKRHG